MNCPPISNLQKTSPVSVSDCPRIFHGNQLSSNQAHTKALLFFLQKVGYLNGYDIYFSIAEICTLHLYNKHLGVSEKYCLKIIKTLTHQALAWGLVWKEPKEFSILTKFWGASHFCFDHFYIVDFHSSLSWPGWEKALLTWLFTGSLSDGSRMPIIVPPISSTATFFPITITPHTTIFDCVEIYFWSTIFYIYFHRGYPHTWPHCQKTLALEVCTHHCLGHNTVSQSSPLTYLHHPSHVHCMIIQIMTPD